MVFAEEGIHPPWDCLLIGKMMIYWAIAEYPGNDD